MGVKFSPIGNGTNWIPGSALVANGYKLFFYAAGTTTKQNTYTSNTGGTPNSNPITLNAYGRPANEIWLTEGLYYKVVIASGSDTDPPSSGVTLGDYITGINDFSSQVSDDQWTASGLTPTYISTTSFSVTGDQTAALHVGRRLKTVNTGGTIYSTITASVYGSVTTVTVVNDSGTLDSGLSAVSYGILTTTNPSIPKFVAVDGTTATTQSATDNSTKLATTAFSAHRTSQKGYIFGLTLSNGTDTTNDINVSSGVCADSTGVYLMTVTDIGKQIDAAWATAGTAASPTGGFPGGISLTNDTWYRFFIIGKTDGTVNAGFDTSSTATNLLAAATGYTLYRQIGWIRRATGANKLFWQNGDIFIYDSPVSDFSSQTPASTTETKTVSIPPSSTGVLSVYFINADATNSSNQYLKIRTASETSAAASSTDFDFVQSRDVTNYVSAASGKISVPVNASSQVKVSVSSASNKCDYSILSTGWVDNRGRLF